MRFVTIRRAGVLLLAASLLGAGVAVHARAVPPHAFKLVVTERDFRISARKHVPSGDLILTVANRGPDDHELIIAKATTARLPVRADGLTVNEDKLGPVIKFTLEPGQPGSVRTARVQLEPGSYVLFCNMAGHFMAGMHTTLIVR